MTADEFFAQLGPDFLPRLSVYLNKAFRPHGDLAYDAAVAHLLNAAPRYQPDRAPTGGLPTFAFAIAVRGAAKAFRSNRGSVAARRRAHPELLLGDAADAQADYTEPPDIDEPSAVRITDAMAVQLRADGYLYREIGQLMGISGTAARNRVLKAARELRENQASRASCCPIPRRS